MEKRGLFFHDFIRTVDRLFIFISEKCYALFSRKGHLTPIPILCNVHTQARGSTLNSLLFYVQTSGSDNQETPGFIL